MWDYLLVFIITSLISSALAPKPPQQPPAALDDFDAPVAEEGRELAVVFGTVWMNSPNVIWYGDLRTAPIKAKGGKK